MALKLTEPHFASLVRLTSAFLNGNGFEKTAKQLQKEANKRGLSLDDEENGDKSMPLETVYSQWQSITDVANLSIPDEEEDSSEETDSSSEEEAASDTSSDESSDSSEEEDDDEKQVKSAKPLAVKAAKERAASVETSDASEVEVAPRGTKRKQSTPSSSESSSEESSDDSSDSEAESSSESDAPAAKRIKSKAAKTTVDSESDSSSSSSSESSESEAEDSSSDSSSDSDSSDSSDDSDSDAKPTKAKTPATTDSNSTSSATMSDTSAPTTVPVAIKRKAPSGEEEIEVVQADQSDLKRMKKNNVPFSRIPTDQYVDPRLSSNKFVPYDYANRAHEKLIVTKGKGFTKKKNKGKRGSYRGGKIDFTPKGIKFDD